MLMESVLHETYNRVQKISGLNPRNPSGFKATMANPEAFKVYARTLAEGLSEGPKRDFLKLCRNTRRNILENSMYQLNPHEVLTLPILRNFYPKLIAKELVNVMPIDKPDVVKTFIKPKFRKVLPDVSGAAYSGYDYEFPSVSTDISRGPSVGIESTQTAATNAETDILAAMGLDATLPAHIEKDFTIVGIIDSTGGETAVNIRTTVDGVFSKAVEHDNGDTDVISGHVDFLNGILHISSETGNTADVIYTAYASLEENTINPTVKFDMEKIRFTVVDRKITAEWSINMEQDAKALFDISVQSEMINIIGEQIALDIDREIINDLFSINTTQNPASHAKTFYKTEDAGYTHGKKAWYENILIPLNELSAQVYNSTKMGAANTIACNPLDAAIFEALNGFEYLGDLSAGGEVGYRSATVASGKWKVLVSSVVTQGKMLVKYRSDDMARASYVYAPYVPALLTPYPLGNNPSLTVMSRYATKSIRPNGLAVLNLNDGVEP